VVKNNSYSTFFLTMLLALAGSVISYATDWIVAIPMFFGLGIPLLNIEKPLLRKVGLTLAILLGNIAIFFLIVILILNIPYESQVWQALVVGIAGALIMILNGWLIKEIKLTPKAILITFILSSISMPLGMWLIDDVIGNSTFIFSDFIKQYGIIMLWMTLTTLGIVRAFHQGDQ
jgi:hypothetical protein